MQRGVRSCAVRDISDVGVGLRLKRSGCHYTGLQHDAGQFQEREDMSGDLARGRYIGVTFQG